MLSLCNRFWEWWNNKQLLSIEAEQVGTKSDENRETDFLREENQRLSERVSRLSSILASKETNLEDVNSNSRPSLTVAKYAKLTTDEWLLAKEVLGRHQDGDSAWHDQLLCRTIQIAVETAKEFHKTSKQEVLTLLNTISTTGTVACEPRPEWKDGELPPLLSDEIDQFIKSNSRAFDASAISERICMKLTSEFPYNFPVIKGEGAVQTFINACAEIAWQIQIQQPPMYISCSPTKFDGLCHELLWEERNLLLGESSEIEYIWPILYESERKYRVLKRGIVKIKSANTKTECHDLAHFIGSDSIAFF